VSPDGTIELSAKDADPLIGFGWPKLGELPDYELPGYEDGYTEEQNEPPFPKRKYAIGSVESEYFSKYQPRFRNCKAGRNVGSCEVPGKAPQISKATLRTASGVLLSIVAMLGRTCGAGNGSAGRFMSSACPRPRWLQA
jgi:hypothetical protein